MELKITTKLALFIILMSHQVLVRGFAPAARRDTWVGMFDKAPKIESHESCDQQKWPIYAGGVKGSEDVRCFAYDTINELILVGGVSNSDDFAIGPNNHGYMFALDLDSNWKWGWFYYNTVAPVSEITGCSLSSDLKSLTVAGVSNKLPIVMSLDPRDGNTRKFITIALADTESKINSLFSYGAVYHDKGPDSSYLYTSFVSQKVLFNLRINEKGSKIDWTTEYQLLSGQAALIQKHEPRYIMSDPEDKTANYLVGRYRGLGNL